RECRVGAHGGGRGHPRPLGPFPGARTPRADPHPHALARGRSARRAPARGARGHGAGRPPDGGRGGPARAVPALIPTEAARPIWHSREGSQIRGGQRFRVHTIPRDVSVTPTLESMVPTFRGASLPLRAS